MLPSCVGATFPFHNAYHLEDIRTLGRRLIQIHRFMQRFKLQCVASWNETIAMRTWHKFRHLLTLLIKMRRNKNNCQSIRGEISASASRSLAMITNYTLFRESIRPSPTRRRPVRSMHLYVCMWTQSWKKEFNAILLSEGITRLTGKQVLCLHLLIGMRRYFLTYFLDLLHRRIPNKIDKLTYY